MGGDNTRHSNSELEQLLPAGLSLGERQSRIQQAMKSLGKRQRPILEMVFVAGMTMEEIAQASGVSMIGIRSRCSRGLKHLRQRLVENKSPTAAAEHVRQNIGKDRSETSTRLPIAELSNHIDKIEDESILVGTAPHA